MFDTMQTFIDARRLNEIVDGFVKEERLIKRGEGDGSQLTLTDAGKAQRKTVFKLHSEVRRRAMQGITEQEYATVSDVLQRMVGTWNEVRNTKYIQDACDWRLSKK